MNAYGAVNASLAVSGAMVRFIPLEPDGQSAWFFCAEPERFAEAARELFLPIGDDPDAARRRGVDFERRVLEQLGASGS